MQTFVLYLDKQAPKSAQTQLHSPYLCFNSDVYPDTDMGKKRISHSQTSLCSANRPGSKTYGEIVSHILKRLNHLLQFKCWVNGKAMAPRQDFQHCSLIWLFIPLYSFSYTHTLHNLKMGENFLYFKLQA